MPRKKKTYAALQAEFMKHWDAATKLSKEMLAHPDCPKTPTNSNPKLTAAIAKAVRENSEVKA
jgi:hypothetical protein